MVYCGEWQVPRLTSRNTELVVVAIVSVMNQRWTAVDLSVNASGGGGKGPSKKGGVLRDLLESKNRPTQADTR